MKPFFALFLGLALAVFIDAAHPAQAQVTDINSAINKAGRQRMLSQRMAKAYLQIGQGIDTERSKKILDTSIALFDRQLVELKNFAPTPEIKDTYLRLEKAWLAYKDVLVGTAPSREQAKTVMDLSETVLQLAHSGTTQLVERSGTESGPLVGVAGRQRMLSQRMAKFYQAISWGVAAPSTPSELDKAHREFNAGLKALSDAPATTKSIRDELDLAKQQWIFFEAAIDARGAGEKEKKSNALNVATTSERLLETMDSITGSFEKLQK